MGQISCFCKSPVCQPASLPNILFYFVFHDFCLLIHTARTERECVQQRENLIDSRNQPCRPLSLFLAILAGVDAAFPPYLWDLLLPQAELTLNLLRQSTLNPWISAWEFFQGPFDFNKTPLGPVGCRVLIHAKPATRRSWDFRAKNGFYIGPAMDSYRCSKLVNADTKSQVISDTVEFRHSYLSVPAPSTEDRIIHGLQVVAGALTGASAPTSISQVESITNLWDIFESWHLLAPPLFQPPQIPMHICPRVPTQEPPRVVSPSSLTPAHPISSSPSWSPPPRPAVSTLLSPTPVHLAGNVADMSRHVGDDTTCRSNFGQMGPCRRHKI
jgi:hypothetical protein